MLLGEQIGCWRRKRGEIHNQMLPASNLNNHILSILEKSNHLNHLKQIQAYLIALGHGQTQFYSFKLVRFCVLSLSDISYARSIFDHLLSPNVYLYTAMITAYTSLSDHLSSFLLYRDMVRRVRGPKPNHFIFPHVLKSCPEVMEYRGTDSLHTLVVKSGFENYPVVQTALLDSYSRFGSDVRIARRLFDEMSERNVVSWTAMVSGYARVGKVANALSLFDEMPERDVPSWNAVIAACTQNGLFTEAISVFRRMVIEEGMARVNMPNQVTVACALSACGHCGMLQLGKCIHAYIYRNCLRLDSFLLNALVDMYGKCANLRQARWIFDKTPNKNLTSWNTIINCLALHGKSGSAVWLFDEMMEHDDEVKPDGITFISLLNACTHGGLLEHGRTYFNLMTNKYAIEPQIEHYGCLIDLLSRAGQFREAMEIVEVMRIPADEVVWGSLLNGCKIHGQTDLAEFAVRKLIEINPNDGGYGIMLANIYGELGKWDDVRRVRETLEERHSYKIPGCSWIEVDDRIHQFYSIDTTHPRTDDIYAILDCIFGVH